MNKKTRGRQQAKPNSDKVRKLKKCIKTHGLRDIDLIKTTPYKEEELKEYRERGLNFLCKHCDAFFRDEHTYKEHLRTKNHKRRMKTWDEPFHTQKDAERAAGLF